MDLDKLKDYVDVYKITSMVNKVKNAVYNYTEYEVKVRDATNNEPWGASSTLMQDIAAGTSHYTHFAEIMDTIYGRFQEKGGSQWRQIYKALQLLEYLIKNGSERVIDSARDRIYELKALKNFHYVDDKGKDQGINVRNRAKEIAELLADNDKIKAERRKAKENRAKYTGLASNGFGSRYGGYGPESESYSSSSGGYGGGYAGGFKDDDDSSRSGQDRYDRPSSARNGSSRTEDTANKGKSSTTTGSAGPQTTTPSVNLLDVGTGNDDWGDFSGGSTATASVKKVDDFADFQSAPIAPVAAPVQPFTSFASPPIPSSSAFPQASSTNNFANFAPPVQAAVPTSAGIDLLGGFGAPTSASMNASRGAAPPAFGQQPLMGPSSSSLSSGGFTKPASNDPFSKLVSLDATSLSGGGKREEAAGPSLNALGTGGLGGFGQFGQFATASQPRPVMGGAAPMTPNGRPMASGTNAGFAAFGSQPAAGQGQNESLF
ncbi:hypothetical protein SpCBS45565_g04946 [Spizellomyces sp. 'palustris']|nr:hypothetical protein SpCBS45565_g04946 [Spizellomyces sp. 'palustris']